MTPMEAKEPCTVTDVQGSILGNSVLRKEDPGLLFGSDLYFDDIPVADLGYIHFVRSPFAHARIERIDTSWAVATPGVRGVYTAENLEMKLFLGHHAFDQGFSRPPLAKNKVRYVGDIVAAIVADSRGIAVDAAELVEVDYEPLEAVTAGEAALAEGSPILFDEVGSNVCYRTVVGEDTDE